MDGKIAIEEHMSTAQNNKYWDAKGEETRNGHAYSKDIERRLLDTDTHLTEMDRAGIEFCVLSLTSPGVQSVPDRQEAIDLARIVNDQLGVAVLKHPDRLSGFAAVAMQDPAAAAAELERAVSEYGFKGALINGYTNVGEDAQYLDDPAVREFWAKAAALDVPVYLHPREPLPTQRRVIMGYPELVGSAWGFGYETGSHAVRLILSGLFDEFPNLQLILGHLGEGLPYLLPRLQHRMDEQREGEVGNKARHRPSYYFARNFYITTSGNFHTRQMQAAVEQIGVERVLFSVDYPYEQMDSAARWFDDMVLGREDKYNIGRGNAASLLKLDLPQVAHAAALGFAS
jgi:predicted TIM-barrel fold metal-dependent hydrolase